MQKAMISCEILRLDRQIDTFENRQKDTFENRQKDTYENRQINEIYLSFEYKLLMKYNILFILYQLPTFG